MIIRPSHPIWHLIWSGSILIRCQRHLNFWWKVAALSSWRTLELWMCSSWTHHSICALMLSVTTQSLRWALEGNLWIKQEFVFQAQLLLQHDSPAQCPPYYHCPTNSWSPSLSRCCRCYISRLTAEISKGPTWQCNLKAIQIPSRNSVYLFTAGVLENSGLRLCFLAPQLSFFSLL